jgi:DNA (cytosine-5)-methyltransferase 1
MDEAAVDLGYESLFGIEAEEKFAFMFAANNRSASVINLPAQEALRQNARAIQLRHSPVIPRVELLLMGIPCQPWSPHFKGLPSEHNLYAITFYALGVILAANPLNVVIEQVPDYVKDPLFAVLKTELEAAGYHVTHKVVDSGKLGYLTSRSRAYIVATTKKGFEWSKALRRAPEMIKARDLLLPPRHPLVAKALPSQGGWFSTRDRTGIGEFMNRKWKQKGHPPAFISQDSKKVPTIISEYYAWQQTGPFVKHPSQKDTYRLLTIEEVRRLHGVPNDYRLPGSPTAQMEALGQGVVLPLAEGIIRSLPGGAPSRTFPAKFRRTKNPPPVVPLWYGRGPMYSTLPWERIW